MTDQPIVLEGRDLHLGGRVNGVSLELRAGEILGLAALEGQGQDQLFQLLSGDRKPDAGEVLVNGERMSASSPYDAIRRGVVLVPADRLQALLPQRSVRDNLTIPLYNRICRWFSLVGDEDTAPYETGTKTIGHFELVEQIGAGTFGSVFKAIDNELDRTVAIKVPRKGQLDPTETEQFLREARAAAQAMGLPP